MVRFGDLMVNNMLTNFLLGKPNGMRLFRTYNVSVCLFLNCFSAVQMTLESLDSASWSSKLISKMKNERNGILPRLKARHLSSILFVYCIDSFSPRRTHML